MVESSDEVQSRIENAVSFRELERIRYYVKYYQNDYADYADLLAMIVDREIELAPGCPARLTFDSWETGNYHAYTPSQKEYMNLCIDARESGVHQIALFYEVFPTLALESWFIRRSTEAPYTPGEEETGINKSLESRQREAEKFMGRIGRAERRFEALTPEEEEEGERIIEPKITKTQVKINEEVVKLMRMNEEIEAELEEYRKTHPADIAHIRELEEAIAKRDEDIARLQKEARHGAEMVSEDLTGTEASYVRTHIKELDSLLYNLEPTETGWRLTVQIKSEGDRVLLDSFLTRAEAYDKEQREKRKLKTAAGRVAGYEFVADILCKVYKRQTGFDCAMSRGTIENLANRMLEYAYENDLIKEPQEYDWESLDLFARKNQRIYKKEQADEAFGVFKGNLNTQIASELRSRGEEEDFCYPEYINPAFLWIYIVEEIGKRGLTMTPSQEKKYDDSIKLLKECGYTELRYTQYLNDAVSWYQSHGEDFFKVAEDEIEQFAGSVLSKVSELAGDVYDYIAKGKEGRSLQDILANYEAAGYDQDDVASAVDELQNTGAIYEYSYQKYKVI